MTVPLGAAFYSDGVNWRELVGPRPPLAAIVTPQQFGAIGDGVADDTVAFQAFLTGLNGRLGYVPNATYKIAPPGFTISDNGTRVICNPGALFQPTTVLWGGGVLTITANDVVWEGGVFDGNKAANPTGQIIGVFVEGNASNVLVKGVTSKNMPGQDATGINNGDGFYVGGGSSGQFVQDVTLENCISLDNVRQGLSITRGKRIHVKGGRYSGTTGTNPGAGIDVEPNASDEPLLDVLIEGATLDDNNGGAIAATNNAFDEDVQDRQSGLIVRGCTFRGQKRVGFIRWPSVIFSNNIIRCGPIGVPSAVQVFFSNGCVDVLYADNDIDADFQDVYGWEIHDSTNVIVKGNTLKNTGRAGLFLNTAASGGGSYLHEFSIDGNTFIDCGSASAVLRFRSDGGVTFPRNLDVKNNRFFDDRVFPDVPAVNAMFADGPAGLPVFTHGNRAVGFSGDFTAGSITETPY